MEELVWRKGERCERSYRTDLKQQQQHQQQQHQQQQQQHQPQRQYDYESTQNEFINKHESENFRQINNKREVANDKINERFLIGKSIQNPFMSSNSYIDDIENQMNFLTPKKGDV